MLCRQRRPIGCAGHPASKLLPGLPACRALQRRLDPLLRRCMYPTREQLLAELQAAAAGGGQPDEAALLRLADRVSHEA